MKWKRRTAALKAEVSGTRRCPQRVLPVLQGTAGDEEHVGVQYAPLILPLSQQERGVQGFAASQRSTPILLKHDGGKAKARRTHDHLGSCALK
jgi:hypothetical protein